MKEKLIELKNHLFEINDLEMASEILSWDQSTYMPPGGAEARGRQLSTLTRLRFEKFTNLAIGKLLDELYAYEKNLSYDSDEASLIRITRRDYERAIKVPPAFVAKLAAHQSLAYQLWAEARPTNNFDAILPALEKTLDFSRQFADFYPGYEHIADPLIDEADNGMKASNIKALFAQLREALIPIVQSITSQEPIDDGCLRLFYPETDQLEFCKEVLQQIGYDYSRGRHDKTHHPFTTKFSIGDVRITTRVKENFLGECLYSMIHEAGHAMYEQGICVDYEGTPLASGTSAGVHESQSRLWENIIGRSRGFWEYFYPKLQMAFTDQLKKVSIDTFYRAVNKVEKSLIRTDADEVTYNLHVMLRFDLELDLLDGKLAVKDLPDAWNERFQKDFGIYPLNLGDGVLQDVHWYAGLIGGSFQGYTLGNILSAQFYEAALSAIPEIPDKIRYGHFEPLHEWLIQNVYKPGRKYTAPELLDRVAKSLMNIDPYMRYLKGKYGEIYKF
jgi:carboxypeptidase Taq